MPVFVRIYFVGRLFFVSGVILCARESQQWCMACRLGEDSWFRHLHPPQSAGGNQDVQTAPIDLQTFKVLSRRLGIPWQTLFPWHAYDVIFCGEFCPSVTWYILSVHTQFTLEHKIFVLSGLSRSPARKRERQQCCTGMHRDDHDDPLSQSDRRNGLHVLVVMTPNHSLSEHQSAKGSVVDKTGEIEGPSWCPPPFCQPHGCMQTVSTDYLPAYSEHLISE
jgi:hypothetical protein